MEAAADAGSNMKTNIRSILFNFFWYDVHFELAGVLQEAGDADSRACTRSQV